MTSPVDLAALERRLRELFGKLDTHASEMGYYVVAHDFIKAQYSERLRRRAQEAIHLIETEEIRALLDVVAVLHQERTQLQGLIETWENKHGHPGHSTFGQEGRLAFNCCAHELRAVLSGSDVSPEAET